MVSVASRLLVQAPRLQVRCEAGAAPPQFPEPALEPIVVSWHQTGRVCEPAEHVAEQSPQAPFCHE